MAYQQPQLQRQRRQNSQSALPPLETATAPARQRSPSPEHREWILFSPSAASDTYDQTDSTVRTEQAGSHLSDFDSLPTAANSGRPQARDDETEDLDSLDDGLHAFGEPSAASSPVVVLDASRDTVLPAHDGLGMFPGNNALQEQLWQHERFNPRRRRSSLRRSSLQRRIDILDEESARTEDDKTRRIEEWRVEQSRAIFEEIEKETRRRRRRSRMAASMSSKTSTSTATVGLSQSAPEHEPVPSRTERLSFWERLTRRVIRDIIGIDDATLEFIFGESLPEEPRAPAASPASALVDTAEQSMHDNDAPLAESTWEERMLARIARELGLLFSHMSEHPGAFSTYLRAQETPAYAGLHEVERPAGARRASEAAPAPGLAANAADDALFEPSLAPHAHRRRHSTMTTDPSLWGIEEENEHSDGPWTSPSAEAARLQREKSYWERDLDVKMVFNFLRSRLASGSGSGPASASTAPTQQSLHQALHQHAPQSLLTPPAAGTQSRHDSLRRAALIRHHHPLVKNSPGAGGQAGQARRAEAAPAATTSAAATAAPLVPHVVLGRRTADSESCASQSTKRSRSSRNYWDHGHVGGSGGTPGGTPGAAGSASRVSDQVSASASLSGGFGGGFGWAAGGWGEV